MRTLLLFLILFLLSATGSAFAQSQGTAAQSKGMFRDIITNTTQPGVVMGARRGVIYGGEFSARNKIMNINLIGFDPPHINAGCGGIDAFMGSFSFISKEQLVAALRSIATAAIGYAFQLALTSMCPQCQKIMSSMQSIMNAVNMGNMNTCEVAQSILQIGGTDKSIAARIEQNMPNLSASVGATLDSWAGKMQGASDTITKFMRGNKPDLTVTFTQGNILWRALKAQNTGVWAVNGGNASILSPNDMLEDVMSLTGTLVICLAGSDNCGGSAPSSPQVGPDGQVYARTVTATMDLKDLIEGSTNGHTVARLVCADTDGDAHGPYGCFNVQRKDDPNYVGLKARLLTVMLGYGDAQSRGLTVDPADAGSNGMITNIAQGNAPNPNEQALLEYGGAEIQMTVKLAILSPEAAREYVTKFAPQIASNIAVNLMSADVNAAMTALNQNVDPNLNLSPIREQIRQAFSKNMEIKAKYDREAANQSGSLAYFEQMMNSLEKALPDALPYGAPQ